MSLFIQKHQGFVLGALVVAFFMALAALVYAVEYTGKDCNGSKKEAMTNGRPQTTTVMAKMSMPSASAPPPMAANPGAAKTGTMNYPSTAQAVVDGYDAANTQYAGAAQSQCAPVAVAEASHPYTSGASGAPKMVSQATVYSSAYPDETADVSLAGKTTYSCAPDVTNVGGCDYALNPDNLMPGSWREGVGCSDGTDPNSQWAKYHPTRDRYYRYITAAGSARLGANTRSSLRKVTGIPNYLRSATSTPVSNSAQFVFNGSSFRDQVLFDVSGQFPQPHGC